MKKILLLCCLLVLLCISAFAVSLKQIYSSDKSTIYNLTVIDSDHNGLNEIYFYESNLAIPWPWSLWLYEGDNNYSYLSINPPCSSESWCAGYIDDDSLADMVGRNAGGPITVWESPDYNSYISNLVWADTADTADPWDAYITDLDQDGKKEILCRARTDWTTRIYECTGDNQYQLVFKDKPPVAAYYGGIAFGDWDGDGRMEFTFADDGAFDQVADVYTYECIGDDTYQLEAQDSVYTKGAYKAAQAGDMDGDGKPEFIIAGRHNDGTDKWDNVITIFEATAVNSYGCSWSITLQTNLSTNTGPNMGTGWDLKTGDIDGDDTLEMVVVTPESLLVFKAFGNDNYQRIYKGITGPGPYSSRLNRAVVGVYDVNKNGYCEIISSGYYFIKPSGTIEYYDTKIYEIMGEATFDSLRATAQDSCIKVNWATSRQFANYGFNVLRASAISGPYSLVHTTYDTIRLDTTLQAYAFNDSSVSTGTKYYYKIQAKALNDTTIFFGPDSATGVAGRPELPITNYEYQLFQNVPNPLRSQTHISYQLAKPGNVSLKIYNTLGQLVNTLVEGHQQPGIYSASWNGKDNSGRTAANGVYIYRLNCGDWSGTKKMIILR